MACEMERQQSDEAARAALSAGNNQVARYDEFTRALQSAQVTLIAAGLTGLLSMTPAGVLAALSGTAIVELRPLLEACSAAINAERTAQEANKRSREALQRYQYCLNNAR